MIIGSIGGFCSVTFAPSLYGVDREPRGETGFDPGVESFKLMAKTMPQIASQALTDL